MHNYIYSKPPPVKGIRHAQLYYTCNNDIYTRLVEENVHTYSWPGERFMVSCTGHQSTHHCHHPLTQCHLESVHNMIVYAVAHKSVEYNVPNSGGSVCGCREVVAYSVVEWLRVNRRPCPRPPALFCIPPPDSSDSRVVYHFQ